MKLRLMTPEGTLFEGEAVSVRGRSPGGEFEILPGHGQWVSSIDPCCLMVRAAAVADDKAAAERLPFAVHGGLIEVHPDSVLILADAAEVGGAIDEERVERARSRAEERLKAKSRAARLGRPEETPRGEGAEVSQSGVEVQEFDSDRARKALARALARLEACAAGR